MIMHRYGLNPEEQEIVNGAVNRKETAGMIDTFYKYARLYGGEDHTVPYGLRGGENDDGVILFENKWYFYLNGSAEDGADDRIWGPFDSPRDLYRFYSHFREPTRACDPTIDYSEQKEVYERRYAGSVRAIPLSGGGKCFIGRVSLKQKGILKRLIEWIGSIRKGVLKQWYGGGVIIIIPKEVVEIDRYAFDHISELETALLTTSLTKIHAKAFFCCPRLKEISVSKYNTEYTYEDGVLFTKDRKTLVRFPQGKGGDYRVPPSVQEIADEAFRGCASLRRVILPAIMHKIGCHAFTDCTSLVWVGFPWKLAEIGFSAFDGCSSLKQISLPRGIVRIEPYTFEDCVSLAGISIPEGVKEIGEAAFRGCTILSRVSLPRSLTDIAADAFDACRFSSAATSSDVDRKPLADHVSEPSAVPRSDCIQEELDANRPPMVVMFGRED